MTRRRSKTLPRPLPAEGALRVRDVRTELAVGSVEDITSRLPMVVYTTDGTDRAASMPTLPVPQQTRLRYPDEAVESARQFIASTGIAQFVDDARAAAQVKSGRPTLVSTRAVLVAMQLLVSHNRPLLMTEVRDVLFCGLTPAMARVLDIPDRPAPPVEDTDVFTQWDASTSALVRRAFHRMLAPIDPSVLPKNRVRTADQAEALKKDLAPNEQYDRAIALDWVCNQLLEAAYRQLPEPVTTRHNEGNSAYCIDATPLPLFARGKKLDGHIMASDPDGGWYVREGDHLDPNETPGRFTRTTAKYLFARDVHLIVTADASHPDRQYMPALPLALTSDIPGKDPAGAARRLFANLKQRSHTPGPLAGDLLYTQQDHAKFQTPAREAGYDLVLGYGTNDLGLQGSHRTGMTLVDGNYYAPCMPDHLVDLVKDLREKTITQAQFKARIQQRIAYRMRTHQKAGANRNERLGCPASGPAPVAKCALKPDSMTDRPTTQTNGVVVDLRRTVNHLPVLTNDVAPKVCQQQAVTVKPTDGAKYRQRLTYGTDEHTALYHRLRQSQEGVHGSAKDEATVALANPGRRRVRGWAAQQLFAAFLLARTATNRILAFLRNAEPDENGDLFVARQTPTATDGEPTMTSGAPPGAANPLNY